MVVYSESRMSSIDINSFCAHVSLNGHKRRDKPGWDSNPHSDNTRT